MLPMKNFVIGLVVALALVGGGIALFGHNPSTKNQPTGSTPTGQPGTTLDYSNRGLTQFPKEILSKTNTTELNLSHNQLSGALPAEIKNLTRLQTLNVSYNNMTGIPAEIGQMKSLKVIDYSYNNITGLPNELGNLTQLQTLDLRGNNPSQQDLNQIRAKLPNTEIKL